MFHYFCSILFLSKKLHTIESVFILLKFRYLLIIYFQKLQIVVKMRCIFFVQRPLQQECQQIILVIASPGVGKSSHQITELFSESRYKSNAELLITFEIILGLIHAVLTSLSSACACCLYEGFEIRSLPTDEGWWWLFDSWWSCSFEFDLETIKRVEF